MSRPPFAVLAAAFLCGSAFAGQGAAAAIASPFFIVPGCLDGHVRTRTLIDTGAAVPFTLLLSPALAEKAHMSWGKTAAFASNGDVGAPVSIFSAPLHSFEIAGASAAGGTAGISIGVALASRGLRNGFDSVVGYEFLKDRIVAFDIVRGKIAFLDRAPAQAKSIPFTLAPRRPLVLVQVTIDGRGPFVAALDTAAEANLISLEAARAVGLRPDAKATINGAGGREDGWSASANVAIRGLGGREEQVIASPAVDRTAREAGARLDAVLGIRNIRAESFVIDYPRRAILFPEETAVPFTTAGPSPRC